MQELLEEIRISTTYGLLTELQLRFIIREDVLRRHRRRILIHMDESPSGRQFFFSAVPR
jgi:hypothetical protein